jgi:hypothetical protein
MARKLNDENLEPKQGRPTLIEQPAAQQRQPQPKKEQGVCGSLPSSRSF